MIVLYIIIGFALCAIPCAIVIYKQYKNESKLTRDIQEYKKLNRDMFNQFVELKDQWTASDKKLKLAEEKNNTLNNVIESYEKKMEEYDRCVIEVKEQVIKKVNDIHSDFKQILKKLNDAHERDLVCCNQYWKEKLDNQYSELTKDDNSIDI